MKAIVYHNYGSSDVLKYEEIEKPAPKDDEVLIKVRAASVNPLDWRMMKGVPLVARKLFRLPKPSITQPGRPGRDVAGQVEAVGRNVTEFKPGDEVFGVCNGAFAEYACASESKLVMKPDNVTFEQAAAVPVAAVTALQGLRDKGQIRAGQKVLINGAAGGVGTFAVQLAKSFDAKDVTGVCSARNVELVRSIGADSVIDYTQEDFTESGHKFDLILDCHAHHSLSACRRVLTPKGRYIVAGREIKSLTGLLARMIGEIVSSWFMSQTFATYMAKINKDDLNVLRKLMEAGKVTPVIDRLYSLTEVPEAISYLEKEHARGKVIITNFEL
jgi:NADPH:quinone reductase-like Zn-dependent oxidoreductase